MLWISPTKALTKASWERKRSLLHGDLRSVPDLILPLCFKHENRSEIKASIQIFVRWLYWTSMGESGSGFLDPSALPPRPSALSPHCPSSGGPAWPSLERQRRAQRGERERGWNVLKAETFLIVHSLRPYVTQADHVTQFCSSRGKSRHYLRHSRSNLIMQGRLLHNGMQTDGQTDGKTVRSAVRETW